MFSALELRAGASESTIGSQLCGSGELWCEVKHHSLFRGIRLWLQSLYFFLGKEVCDGAEYQECAGEANHRPPATATHQPAGERPSEMLFLSYSPQQGGVLFALRTRAQPWGLPGARWKHFCFHSEIKVYSLEPSKEMPFTHLYKLPPVFFLLLGRNFLTCWLPKCFLNHQKPKNLL